MGQLNSLLKAPQLPGGTAGVEAVLAAQSVGLAYHTLATPGADWVAAPWSLHSSVLCG